MESRHRKPDPSPEERPQQRKEGGTPAAIPPHPPLMSGGWYHGRESTEAHYPPEPPPDRSVGSALVLGVLFGPAGICYSSVTAGLIAIGATAIALILFGYVALLVIWPLAIGAAVISARIRHGRSERQ